MRSPVQTPVTIFVVASLLIIGGLNLTPCAQADGSAPEKVPEPQVSERHDYNTTGYVGGTLNYLNHEKWEMKFKHGSLTTTVAVRNITQYSDNATSVDYANYIEYKISGTTYVAQFMMNWEVFKIGDQTIWADLSTCADFELTYSPVKYDGTIPTLDCNVSFDNIRVYGHNHSSSTFDLTLSHHFRGDWNRTNEKIEALFDFSNTKFYQSNGTEFSAGEPFTAEIQYGMYMLNNEKPPGEQFIAPTGHTNTTLEYNLTLDNGSPLTLSSLNMNDNFTIYNGSGARAWVGYSSMVPDAVRSGATHGFPNLTYKDTVSIKSDPEIIVNHDRVTAQSDLVTFLMPIVVVVAIAAMGAAVFMRKRKKKPGKDSETQKKKG